MKIIFKITLDPKRAAIGDEYINFPINREIFKTHNIKHNDDVILLNDEKTPIHIEEHIFEFTTSVEKNIDFIAIWARNTIMYLVKKEESGELNYLDYCFILDKLNKSQEKLLEDVFGYTSLPFKAMNI